MMEKWGQVTKQPALKAVSSGEELLGLRTQVDATRNVTVRYGFYVLPGRISMTGCYALTPDYPAYKPVLEKVVASFRPW